MISEGLFPLSRLEPGKKGVVVQLDGGGEFQQRIASLGVYLGCEVEILGGGGGERLLLAIGDTRIAFGCGMAEKVMVIEN